MYKLKQLDDRLALVDDELDNPLGKAISVDFTEGALKHRADYGGGRRQLLARAIGCHKHKGLNVIDATAGLGKDSYVLANLGCSVVALERNPEIYALLSDGIQRGLAAGIDNLQRITLLNSDTQLYLQSICDDQHPDVIYFDPMYPHSNKSALVKKDMRILRQIVGDDHDNADLLSLAIARAKYRVVIKRPLQAEFYAGQQADFHYQGKRSRFDIYLPITSNTNK